VEVDALVGIAGTFCDGPYPKNAWFAPVIGSTCYYWESAEVADADDDQELPVNYPC